MLKERYISIYSISKVYLAQKPAGLVREHAKHMPILKDFWGRILYDLILNLRTFSADHVYLDYRLLDTAQDTSVNEGISDRLMLLIIHRSLS